MASIDERVVKMLFDNKDFEKNAQTSISTLDKLKNALNLKGAQEGFTKVQQAASKFDLSAISNAAETVQERFSTFGIFAARVLENLADTAFNVGRRIVSALTIDPLLQGWGEYELQNESIRTIMASSGESIETVKRKIGELNTYADKTIYSFSDMTSSIGKFTNQGVNLNDATLAIQGIANAAALAGSNTQQASSAMYNFAQSLASGYMQLVDWRSIDKIAGVGNQRFRQEMLDTALAMGTVRKEGDMYVTTTKNLQGKVSEAFNASKNFESSLNHQWMTTEVMLETLRRYADNTTDVGAAAEKAATQVRSFSALTDTIKEAVGTGWTDTFTLMFGDVEEAAELWTRVNNALGPVIQSTTDYRNEILKVWRAWGGREAIIDGLADMGKAVKRDLGPALEPLRQLIPTADALGYRIGVLSNDFYDWAKNLTFSKNTIQLVTDISQGLANILEFLQLAFRGVSKIVGPLATNFFPRLADSLLPISNFFEKITSRAKELIAPLRSTTSANEQLSESVSKAWSALKRLLSIFTDVLSRLLGLDKPLDGNAQKMRKLGDAVSHALSSGLNILAGVLNTVSDALINLRDKGYFDLISRGVHGIAEMFGYLAGKAKELVGGAFNKAINLFGKLKDFISGILPSVDETKSAIGGFFNTLKTAFLDIVHNLDFSAVAKTFSDIIMGIGNTAMGLGNLSMFSGIAYAIKKIFDLLTNTDWVPLFGDLNSTLKDLGETAGQVFDKLGDAIKSFQVKVQAEAFKKVAEGILMLAAALVVLSLIKPDKLGQALGTLAAALAEVTAALFAMSKISSSGFTKAGKGGIFAKIFGDKMVQTSELSKTASAFLKVSAGILVLAGALKILSSLDWNELAVGLAGVAGLLIEIGLFLNAMSGIENMPKIGASMVGIGIGLMAIAGACALFAQLSFDQLIQGLVGVGAALFGVVLFFQYLNETITPAQMLAAAASMLIMAVALGALSIAVFALGSMDMNTLVQGLIACGGALLIMCIALGALGEIGPSVLAGAAAILIVSAAMVVLAAAIMMLSSVDPDAMGYAVFALAGAMLVMAVALGMLGPQAILAGAGLTIASVGMVLIAAAINMLAGTDPDGLAAAIITMAAALIVMAGAVALFTPLIAGAAGLLLASVAVVAMAVAMKMLGSMSLEQIGAAFLALAGGMLELIGAAALAIPVTPALIAVAAAIIALSIGAALGGAAIMLLTAAIGMLMGVLQVFVSLAIGAFNSLTQAVLSLSPNVIEPITQMTEVLKNFVEVLGGLASAMMMMGFGFLQTANGINQLNAGLAVFNTGGAAAVASAQALSTELSALMSVLPGLAPAAAAAMLEFANAMVQGIHSTQTQTGPALKSLLDSMGKTLIGESGNFKRIGSDLMLAFISGISSQSSAVGAAAGGIASGGAQKLSSYRSAFYDSAVYSVQGYVNGLYSMSSSVTSAAASLGRQAHDAYNAALNIHSPSKAFYWSGQMSAMGAALGMQSMAGYLEAASEETAQSALQGFANLPDLIQDCLDNDELVLTPVLNSAAIDNQLAALNGGFINFNGRAQSMYLGGRARTSADLESQVSALFADNMGYYDDKLDRLEYALERLVTKETPDTNLYLDGKRLASALAKPMDRALGIRSKRGGLAP